MYELGRNVMPFNGSEKADRDRKYYNRRAEAWWECAEHLSKAELGCRNMSADLRKDLTAPRYDYRNGRILIEPKADIKARLNRSPDKGDCYVMGVWGLKRMRPRKVLSSVTDALVLPGDGASVWPTTNPIEYTGSDVW